MAQPTPHQPGPSPTLRAAFPSSFRLPPEVEVRASSYTQALHPKVRGAVRAGLMLEKHFAKGLLLWTSGQATPDWTYHFQFGLRDALGQLHLPDHVLVNRAKGLVVCLETKLTFSGRGIEQLSRYAPLLSRHFGDLPVIQVLVAETLRPGVNQFPFVKSLDEVLSAQHEGPFIWHLWQPLRWLSEITPPLVLPPVDFEPKLGVLKKKARRWPVVTVSEPKVNIRRTKRGR